MGMYGWHDNELEAYNVIVENDLTVKGTISFGDEAADKLIIKGRVSSMTAAGSAIQITSDYAYGEGIEMRYQVTDWTGVGSSFKGMYLRSEAITTAATGKSIYGAEVYGVCNNVTMTTGSLWGALFYSYVKGMDAITVNNMYAVQGELSWDASRTGDCTITTAAACFRAKITGGRVADYTKIHGYELTIGEMDGDSAKFGSGLLMQDDTGMSGTCTLTTGINIAIECTTGIQIGNCTTAGITISGTAATAQINIAGTAILTSGEQAIYVNCPSETVATNGVWVTLKSTVTSGDLTGGRFISESLRETSGGPNVRGVYGQARCKTASKYAALLQGGLFVADYNGGSATVTNMYGVTGFISQGSGLTTSGNVAAVQAHLQTRSDETIGVHTGVLIHNEAVGGNGLCLAQGAIYITESSLGGSVKGFDCLIDASTATMTVHDTDRTTLMKFKDSGGTVRKLVFDPTNNTVVAVQT